MTIRPESTVKRQQDTSRPSLPSIPRQTAPAPGEIEFFGPLDGGGSYSTTRGELDNPFFDESTSRG